MIMLERGYTIPLLLGICLGAVIAGVQISATALGAAVGQNQYLTPAAIENVFKNGAAENIIGAVAEKTAYLSGLLREKAGLLPGKISGMMEHAGLFILEVMDFLRAL